MISNRRSLKFFITLAGFCIILSGRVHVYSQLAGPGKPYPLNYKGSPELVVCDIPVSEKQKMESLLNEDSSSLKPARSGILIDVDFTTKNNGVWDTLPDGTKVWRMAVQVKEATTMSLIFSPWHINKGVKVFMYNKTQQYIAGAFTDRNNKPFDMLATQQIPGDLLIIEIQLPAYLDSPGSIGISGVGCDFKPVNSVKTVNEGWYGQSGSCNIDVICDPDTLVQILKNAVVRIVFHGTERCTGTLVNTANHNGINYILTAAHCFTKNVKDGNSYIKKPNEQDANTAVFYFNYESPSCEGPDGNDRKALSGATIRAWSDKLDLTLLELFEPIPVNFRPYYAGWDYTGHNTPSGMIIHHPMGDVKKISRENQPLTVATYQGFNRKTHWLVRNWFSGTTEPGSSGGPLFDAHGRVIGTLTGGDAYCANSINDYFQMFSHSWYDYTAVDHQLACWLDPMKRTNGYLEGYDPWRNFWKTGDTLTNIIKNETLKLEKGSLSWGSFSGHNSDYLTGFADRFSVSGSKKMPGLLLHVARNYAAGLSPGIHVKVWNGQQIPANLLYEKIVSMDDLAVNTINYVEFDSIITVSPVFFAGYELEYRIPQDTFSVYMAEGRLSGSINTAYVDDGAGWTSLEDYTNGKVISSYAIYPLVFDSVPIFPGEGETSNVLTAFPNPTNSTLWVGFRELTTAPVRISLINMHGQVVFDKRYGTNQHQIPVDLSGIAAGIYVVRVNDGNRMHNLKVAVMK